MRRKKQTSLLIDDVLEDFINSCIDRDLRIKTIEYYESTLKLFCRYIEDVFKVTDIKFITKTMCKDYVIYTKERGKYTFVSDSIKAETNIPKNRNDYGKKVGVATLNNYIRNLKVFFNYLVDKKVIKVSPMDGIKMFKNNRIPKSQITTEEYNRLIRYLDTTKFHEFRDYTIIQLLMDTGMRIGECLALKVDDIDLNYRSILLRQEITKGRKDRYVFYSYIMSKMLKRWLQYKDRYVETDLLFCTKGHNQLAISNFESNFQKYVKRAKIDKHITAHVLRNNYARRFLLAGGSIFELSKLLGHSSVLVTEKAYADITVEDIRKNYQRYSPLENMNKQRH
ncbi:tyrosine-type recombinase/integrase [Clostridium tyrobutyricum]|uniref:DNA integration/recombination protein n=1 Tax=Clostridium tyrobutyricum DIVETGP TaxID=1408889 RepID=W6N1A4_CLOTY|nr:site-specific integrase [Clostridium tyrobutyricum]AND85194.1 DNA integration/recombination protein [Clostridium tyrobutyricum]ANP69752.1 integrase [Clostridium tyrobutyricum]MBV4432887.1 site-specific integrase [Clostridium tyrobutyricum]QNB65883.1 tyrosine-type recombinase/integrase [Clostridium tyrobutyricum]CDL90013.1 DNA integration/recombination protein [Clostridium tyrobutyricum DIVETGP]